MCSAKHGLLLHVLLWITLSSALIHRFKYKDCFQIMLVKLLQLMRQDLISLPALEILDFSIFKICLSLNAEMSISTVVM